MKDYPGLGAVGDLVIHMDSDGIEEVLRSPEMADLMLSTAEEIDGAMLPLPDGDPVVIDQYETDRQAASVTIAHPLGKLWQARDGVLTKAAAAVGLDVKEKRG